MSPSKMFSYPKNIKPKVGCKIKADFNTPQLNTGTFYKVVSVCSKDHAYPGLVVAIPPDDLGHEGWVTNGQFEINYQKYQNYTFWHVYPSHVTGIKQYESVFAPLS